MKRNLLESNPRVDKHLYRKEVLSCTYCQPNKGENTKRKNQYQKRHKCWKLKRRTKFNQA